jgi:Flp pilus assembly protein TadB
MSAWGIVPVSLVALVLLTLPSLMAQASRSGRMARWDERVRRWYERSDRRAAEGWTPPWWYPPVVGSTLVLWALVVWLLTHDVAQAGLAVVLGIVPTIMAVVARRQAGGKSQHSRHR